MPESTQHKLDRVRPPRVQITYDVETRGSFVKKELPFVVGIMADLSTKGGQMDADGKAPLPLRDKKYLELDRDNFNDIMKGLKPSVSSINYTFESLEDFSPIRLLLPANTELNKIDPADVSALGKARADYLKRTRLSDVVAKLDGNVPLQQKFIEQLKNNIGDFKKEIATLYTEAATQIAAAGAGSSTANAGETPSTSTGTSTGTTTETGDKKKGDASK